MNKNRPLPKLPIRLEQKRKPKQPKKKAPGIQRGMTQLKNAHSFLKSVTGFGEYIVKSNTLVTSTPGVPVFSQSDRITRIRHREYIKDVSSSLILTSGATNFSVDLYNISPTNSSLFPWLGQIARNYQQYRFKGLLFCFESKSGNSVSSLNSALGTVIMATNYNVSEPSYYSKQQMEASEFATATVSSKSAIHPVECDPKEQITEHFLCETKSLLNNEDPKFYNVGTFQIATVGQQAAGANLGELWVTYDVEFLKPQKDITVSNAHFRLAGNFYTGVVGTTNTAIYNSNGDFIKFDQLAATMTINTAFYGIVRVIISLFSPLGYIVANNTITISGNLRTSNIFINGSTHGNAAFTVSSSVVVYEFLCFGGGVLQFGVVPVSAPDSGAKMDIFVDSVAQDDNY